MIVFGVYILLGWWACNRTIYAHVVRCGSLFGLYFKQLLASIFLGWILIPIAVVTLSWHR